MIAKEFKREAIVLYLISILFFISITAFDPFISTYANELGLNPSVIGTIVGAAGIASMLSRFPVGIISDFIDKKRLIIQMGLVVTIIAWSFAFINPSAISLYIAKIADGLTGATWVIYNVMFVSYFSKKEAAKAVGILAIVSPLGSFIGSFVGGLIANEYGYKYSFLVAIIAAALALLLTFTLKKEKKEVHNIKHHNLGIVKKQLADKYIWLLGILAIISTMVPFATRDTFTPIIATELGANPIFITILSNVHMITNAVAASLTGTFFYKRIGLVNTAILGAVGQGIIAIMVPFASNLGMLLFLQGLAGFTFGLSFTVLTSLSIDEVPPEEQSTRMGLFQSIYSVGMFFGPMLIGNVAEHNSMVIGFMIIGVISILSGILTKKLRH